MGLLCYTEEQMDEDEEDEDEGASERPALTSTRDREPLTEPDYETASRLRGTFLQLSLPHGAKSIWTPLCVLRGHGALACGGSLCF